MAGKEKRLPIKNRIEESSKELWHTITENGCAGGEGGYLMETTQNPVWREEETDWFCVSGDLDDFIFYDPQGETPAQSCR